jgi:glucosamine kinase
MTIPAAAIRFTQGFRLGQVQEHHSDMSTETLLLGVDGGATLCRARLQAMSGELLGESMAGPANICIGAHGGRDGGVLVVGTGTVGWAELAGRSYRVGGWGPAVSDEGGGAWLGCEALRRVLWARDGRIPWTALLTAMFEQYEADPHAIVSWSSSALPRDFGALAPVIVEHASNGDPAAVELMRLAAGHVDALAQRLMSMGAQRLSLVGGLSLHIERWLAPTTRRQLSPPAGDALEGALQLARAAAGSTVA